MNRDPDYWIEKLTLAPHREGGFFKEIFRSGLLIPGNSQKSSGSRAYYTSIYYLLKSGQCSCLHRLASDEIWHFYEGVHLKIIILEKNNLIEKVLGNNPEKGESFQALVPAGKWFGAYPLEKDSYSLVGCTMAPGFEYADFESGDANELIGQYPEHESIIRQLT